MYDNDMTVIGHALNSVLIPFCTRAIVQFFWIKTTLFIS
jgi:hypothetical protein